MRTEERETFPFYTLCFE